MASVDRKQTKTSRPTKKINANRYNFLILFDIKKYQMIKLFHVNFRKQLQKPKYRSRKNLSSFSNLEIVSFQW